MPKKVKPPSDDKAKPSKRLKIKSGSQIKVESVGNENRPARGSNGINSALPPRPNENDQNQLHQLIKKVFENKMIRETVLGYVVASVGTPIKDICSVRLVQRQWRSDATKILLKFRKPLYRLTLSKNNSLGTCSFVRKNGMKCLDKFTGTMANTTSLFKEVGSPVPLQLVIHKDFFCDENQESFTKFLTTERDLGVVKLDISVPKDGGSMDLLVPASTLLFSLLQMATVTFCKHGLVSAVRTGTHGSNSYFLPFLQSILTGAKALKHLEIIADGDFTPAGVKYMILPSSITSITFYDFFLNSSKMEILVRNSFSHLSQLILEVPHVPNSNDLLFRILDNVRTTLQRLFLRPKDPHGEPLRIEANYFRFPVMEQLEMCSVNTSFASIEPEISLQLVLPKLKNLVLLNHTVDMLRRWTDHSLIPTVTYFMVGLVDPENKENSIPIHLDEMKAIHRTFSGLTVLDLTVSGRDYTGFHYLFANMKRLEFLKIRVTGNEHIANPNYWNSLFIGVPIDVAAVLSTESNWKYLKVKKDKKSPSIRNLSALCGLDLICELPQGIRMEQQHSLLSDAVFHFAFLKMPNLKKLYLKGMFLASPEMSRAWNVGNRRIVYTP